MTTSNPPSEPLPPFARSLGVQLQEYSKDLVVGTLLVTAEHANRNGVMHGGAVMAFADALGGVASGLNLPEGLRTTTIESKTNFLRAVPIGKAVVGRCVPIHRGRTTMVWQTTLLRADGKPAAITSQTQLILEWAVKGAH